MRLIAWIERDNLGCDRSTRMKRRNRRINSNSIYVDKPKLNALVRPSRAELYLILSLRIIERIEFSLRNTVVKKHIILES